MCHSPMMPFEDRIHEHGADDDAADDDLLEKRRHAEQVQAVSQHAHDKRADQRAAKRSFAAHQAGAADHGRGNRVELVHHAGDRLRRIEARRQNARPRPRSSAPTRRRSRSCAGGRARPTAASPPRCRQSRRRSGRTSSASARGARRRRRPSSRRPAPGRSRRRRSPASESRRRSRRPAGLR